MLVGEGRRPRQDQQLAVREGRRGGGELGELGGGGHMQQQVEVREEEGDVPHGTQLSTHEIAQTLDKRQRQRFT